MLASRKRPEFGLLLFQSRTRCVLNAASPRYQTPERQQRTAVVVVGRRKLKPHGELRITKRPSLQRPEVGKYDVVMNKVLARFDLNPLRIR
jgi:hypothetical protein